ncbi:MAG: DUF167 domain-containing protein [Gammaproteobacteria bacterium]
MKRTWCRERADGIEMRLRVHPGTRCNQVVGAYGDRLKVNIASPPVGGKANEALIAFLAREFATARSQIEIVSGQRTPDKRVVIRTPYQAPVWCGSDRGT